MVCRMVEYKIKGEKTSAKKRESWNIESSNIEKKNHLVRIKSEFSVTEGVGRQV